uniref:Malic acid transport protein n=1 Tax=Kalmanozyma brasiliensis (strain GHG001) TaxID=1365824 RepID=V5EZ76_KALBG
MSLGGIANLLLSRIIDSTPLFYVGTTLYLLNLLYILILVSLQIARFTLTRASLRWTLSHPLECCFVPTVLLACATSINGLALILGDLPARGWEMVLRVLFWAYFTSSLLISLVCYTSLFSRGEQSLHHMSPAWVLPIFPLMLCGSVAAVVVPTQTPTAALAMAIGGLTCQGLGFGVSCMMYAVLLLRLMTEGWPPAKARPGLFMNCGPPAFTILCLLGLNSEAGRILPVSGTQWGPLAGQMLAVMATVTSIALWMLSAWFYLLTLASLVQLVWDREERARMEFMLAWWASVFPNTGFAMATNELGTVLGSSAVRGVAKGMVVWLLIVFIGVAVMHVRAVVRREIMVEGKDEDRVIDTMFHRDLTGDVETA